MGRLRPMSGGDSTLMGWVLDYYITLLYLAKPTIVCLEASYNYRFKRTRFIFGLDLSLGRHPVPADDQQLEFMSGLRI